MKQQVLSFLFVSLFSLSFFSCEDDNADIGGGGSNACTTLLPNKLSASVDGIQWCADSACIADFGTELFINGITMDGRMMTLFIDSLEPGTYTMDSDVNYIQYLDQNGLLCESTASQPGELVILSHDPLTNRVKGRFNVIVRDPLLGSSHNISSATFDVIYIE